MTDADASKTKDLVLPPAGDPDRKRVLGVLAQRRYRQRVRMARRNQATSKDSVTKGTIQHNSDHDQSPKPTTTEPWPAYGITPATTGLDTSNLYPDMSSSSDSAELGFFGDQFMSGETLSTSLQELETTNFAFPDDRTIDVPALKMVRAAIDVATVLNCVHLLWDPLSTHVVDPATLSSCALPSNYYPVDVQLRIPHHPVLDVLPWPTVRSKLIRVFAMPLHLRPPSARDQLALVNLVYDLEDESEGCRVEGPDGTDVSRWEVGQKVFRNWWWAFDREVVQQSNLLRLQRGARRLTLESTE